MNDSRISGLYRRNIAARLETLVDRGFISVPDAASLRKSNGILTARIADRMVENVVSVFGLPFAIAPNFLVNDRDYVVPMVIEEPSVVAAVSGAARLMRRAGGFRVEADDPILVGQVHLVDIADPDAAIVRLQEAAEQLLQQANELQANMYKRGGGARAIEFCKHELPDNRWTVVAHIAVDTRDAMGANHVNTVCEGLAARLEALSGGTACLRILSNLADRSLVTSSVTLPLASLQANGYSAEQVRDGIILANDLAVVDRYRAATHNKGIMNGVDAVAVATGNDWRSIEAAAHAYACRDGTYRSLTRWSATESGDLKGELTMPLKVGIVGGSLQSNPAAAIGLRIVAVESATELATVMCSVGLAQNFAALRALVTSGIQRGHMSLHARSVASVAGAPPEIFDRVVDGLIESGEIKEWKATELIAGIQQRKSDRNNPRGDEASVATGAAAGKVILFGEHAAVYGRYALALPITNGMTASCRSAGTGITLRIPDWGVAETMAGGNEKKAGAAGILTLLLKKFNLSGENLEFVVRSRLPAAVGLGSSAALATVLARTMSDYCAVSMSDEQINDLSYECERLSHGDPSGLDNTLSVFGQPLLFKRNKMPFAEFFEINEMPQLVVAYGSRAGTTKAQVAGVRARYEKNPSLYDRIFDDIDSLSLAGMEALKSADYDVLGAQMNVCHGLLNAIEVSTPELERMVTIARTNGALGAKLTGAGGGGSIVALCPDSAGGVKASLVEAGYRTLLLNT